ncbi:MAG: pyridoxamine 5'-phosphate oxidase [Burkholderiales bacterium]
MKIADLRQEYMRAGLAEADIDRDPIAQFARWFDEALRAGVPLANAMTLATVDAHGAPSARIVLLKGIEQGGFTFFTNYQSRKALELEAHRSACLVFMWSQLERQVRIDGAVERVSADESDAYFSTRPLGARLSAWASPQSEIVPDRGTLERAAHAARERYGDSPPRPPHWGGYRVRPRAIEFWQGRADRLHDRLVFTLEAHGWRLVRLAP